MKKVISLVLSFVLLWTCVPFAFAAEEEELTLERLMQAYEEKDMDFLREAINTISPPLPEEIPTDPAPRWASGDDENTACHQQLTAYGFLLYLGDMQELLGMSVSQMGYTLNDMATLTTYSAMPDKDEMGMFFASHFYNPDTQKSWDPFSATARDKAVLHYDNAIMYSRQGNRNMAMQELGRALHFLQDANEPHHAANLVAGLSTHSSFETFATNLLHSLVEEMKGSFDMSRYNSYAANSVGISLHTEAVFAKNFSSLANTMQTTAGYETSWQIAAFCTLLNSMYSTSALLYRFSKNVS